MNQASDLGSVVAGPDSVTHSEEMPLSEGHPAVSVIVPVYNDPEGIRTTLESLLDQSAPRTDYEIIVVDNGSTDRTRAVVERFADRFDNVRLEVESELQGSYAARNRGIRASRGSVLAFVDADMSVDPDWLSRAVEVLKSTDAEYLACAVHIYPPERDENLVGKYNRLTDLQVGRFVRRMRFAPTCSLFVRRSLLEDVGLFDLRFRSSGDLEFCHRVDAAGRTLYYAPEILMYHPARTTLRALLRKSFRIGRGKVELHRFYPERYGHPLRRLLNPQGYLPPSPWYVKSITRNWDELRRRDRLGFYLLTYVSRLAKSAGQLWEAGDSLVRSIGTFRRRLTRIFSRP